MGCMDGSTVKCCCISIHPSIHPSINARIHPSTLTFQFLVCPSTHIHDRILPLHQNTCVQFIFSSGIGTAAARYHRVLRMIAFRISSLSEDESNGRLAPAPISMIQHVA
mmetsp:Transcript_21460/g.59702  ORF Transcript_21460/g.59702 Transcript_21460/m.59702 type:complete len:109 (-) Transcript_21460:562-888(-)